MKKIYLLAALMVVILFGQRASMAQFVNGQNANVVLGQANFTTGTAATTASGMNQPRYVAVDPATGKVFVADNNNHRVLRFSSLAAATNGSAAEAVLGQPNFTSRNNATTQSGMTYPTGVAVDGSGNLYVAESYNSRVLRFANAASLGNGANATSVLGRPDFTTGATATTQSGMYKPYGIAVDGSGNLYVADFNNHRVLRFANAASLTNGANATTVLGQATFTAATGTTSQSGMNYPTCVAVDGSGNLYVGEFGSNRVLRFANAASLANGANATSVLGQATFTGSYTATTQSGMTYPYGIAVDGSGNLYVGDYGANRVLRFANAAALANGANATSVFGQTTFISQVSATSPSGMNSPVGVGVDGTGNVYVADFGNNRMLRFNAGTSAAPVDGVNSAVREFRLLQNYPNPFNPTTVISYQLPISSQITLKVYDVLGREVATLVNEHKAVGSYTATFDASQFASGVYFYKLQAGGFVQTKKMLLVK